MTRKKKDLMERQRRRAERLLAKLKDVHEQMAGIDSIKDIPMHQLEQWSKEFSLALSDLQRPYAAMVDTVLIRSARLRRKGYHKGKLAAIDRHLECAEDYMSQIVDEDALADAAMQSLVNAMLLYNDLLKTPPKKR